MTLLAGENQWRQPLNINYLDIVIGVEVVLIVLLCAKFARDIHSYRRAGQLPWPLRSPARATGNRTRSAEQRNSDRGIKS